MRSMLLLPYTSILSVPILSALMCMLELVVLAMRVTAVELGRGILVRGIHAERLDVATHAQQTAIVMVHFIGKQRIDCNSLCIRAFELGFLYSLDRFPF